METPSLEWIIYYSDGRSFLSTDGAPHEAPREEAQVVAVANRSCGKLLWCDYDYYCWQDGTWIPHSETGMRRYRNTAWPVIILEGYAISDKRFQEIYLMALNDPRMPPKTGDDVRERVNLR